MMTYTIIFCEKCNSIHKINNELLSLYLENDNISKISDADLCQISKNN